MKNFFLVYFCIAFSGNIVAQSNTNSHHKYTVGTIFTAQVRYYGDMFEGRRTANGEKFSNDSLTCSHPKLPFNTIVYITNNKTGYSVTLRVNDRGLNPAHPEMYVTQTAAAKLGMPRTGVLTATVHIIGRNGIEMQEEDKSIMLEAEIQRQKNLAALDSSENNMTKIPVNIVPGKNIKVKKITEKANTNTNTVITYDLEGNAVNPQGYGVQLFSVDNLKTAEEISRTLVEENIESVLFIQQGWVKGKKVYRIMAGAAPIEAAKELADKLRKRGHKGFVQKHITS
jgi:rare lipoprotein A